MNVQVLYKLSSLSEWSLEYHIWSAENLKKCLLNELNTWALYEWMD